MSQRSVCVHCNKPYGRRATDIQTVKWPIGKPMPPYRGNGVVLKRTQPYRTTSRATIRALTMVTPANKQRVEEDLAKIPEHAEQVSYITVWDGETWWGGYPPFCTLRCALNYARKAYSQAWSQS